MNRIVVINFGHPLSDLSHTRISEFLDTLGWIYIHRRLYVSFSNPLVPQIVNVVNEVEKILMEQHGMRLEQAGRVCMITPGLSDPAVLLAMELIGRTGEFPSMFFQKKDMKIGGYHVYDWSDGYKLKNDARGRRS